MEKVGFIGAYDKIDLMLNVSKILNILGKEVLIIDTTINQKAKYIVPHITPTAKYITTYENVDVAIGFENMKEIKEYVGEKENLPYDIALIDIDRNEYLEKYDMANAEKNFFVTAFDTYSLKRGIETFIETKETMNLTKVLFCRDVLKEDDDYLNYISEGFKIKWSENRIYFPIEIENMIANIENQRQGRIRFKKLTIQYKEAMIQIIQEIDSKYSEGKIRKTIKSIEKGV